MVVVVLLLLLPTTSTAVARTEVLVAKITGDLLFLLTGSRIIHISNVHFCPFIHIAFSWLLWMRTAFEHMNRDIRMKTKADGIAQVTCHKGLVETFASPRV